MRSPYTVLGVNQTAKTEEIKSAYRQLAKIWHPDQNPGNPNAGPRFAEISRSYKLLIDSELRKQFDQGDIDAYGKRRTKPVPQKPRSFVSERFNIFKNAAKGAQSAQQQSDADDDAFFEDMVAHIFGTSAPRREKKPAAQHARQPSNPKPTPNPTSPPNKARVKAADAPNLDEDPLAVLDTLFAKWKLRHRIAAAPRVELPPSHHKIETSLEDVFSGFSRDIAFPDGTRTSLYVPAGTVDRAELRVSSPNPAKFGDAIVTLHHLPHSQFRTSGHDIHGDQGVNLEDAVLGGSIVFNGIDGPLKVEVPEWSNSDLVLRVMGKGLPKGDGTRGALHIHLRIMLPEKPDARLTDLMRFGRKAFYV